MVLSSIHIAFGIVIVVFFSWASAQGIGPGACGTSHEVTTTTKNLKISFHGGQKPTLPASTHCTWSLNVRKEAFLQAKDFYLTNKDTFSIFHLLSNETELILGPFFGRQGPFVIALPEGNFALELHTTDDNYPRGFLLQVENSCTDDALYKFTSAAQPGAIRSPVYSKLHKGSFVCTMDISGYGVANSPNLLMSMSVIDFNIPNGSLTVTENRQTGQSYDFVHDFPPPVFFTKSSLKLSLTINTEIQNQFLVLEYEIVSESCSKVIHITSENSTALISLNVDEEVLWLPLNCYWLVTAPVNHNIHTSSPILKLPDIQDRLIIAGPSKSDFTPVLITSTSHGLTQVDDMVIPGNSLIMRYVSPRPQKGTALHLTVSLSSPRHDFYENHGVLMINQSSVDQPGFKLRVKEDQYIKLTWSTHIPESAVLAIYEGFNLDVTPFFKLSQSIPVNKLTLPFSDLQIVVQSFPSALWSLSFEGVHRNLCDQIGTGAQVLFESSQNCRSSNCSWIVPPNEKEGILHLSFPKLDLGPAGYMNVYKMEYDRPAIATFNASSIHHSIHVSAQSGLLMNFHTDCSTGKPIIKALVSFKPVCRLSVVVGVGESVQIESPGYPEAYPLNSDCQWILTTKARFLALRFNQVSLSSSESHILIAAADKTVSVSGQPSASGHYDVLPNDEVLEAPVTVHFQAPLKSLNVPLSPGFLLTAVAFECGGLLSAPKGYVRPLPNSNFCMWTISGPEQNYHRTQLRLHIPYDNRAHLKIFDGGSIRNNLLTPNEDGVVFSSGPKVFVIYQAKSQTVQDPLLQYTVEHCDESNICGNGQCLQQAWICNGVNDCGDYSDERDCSTPRSAVSCPPCPSIPTTRSTPCLVSTPRNKTSTPPTTVSRTLTSQTNNDSERNPETDDADTGVQTPQPHSSTDALHKHTDDDHHHRQDSHPSVCTTPLALAITGSLVVGIIVGALVTAFAYRQVYRRKEWSSLQSSNTGLAVDNVSL